MKRSRRLAAAEAAVAAVAWAALIIGSAVLALTVPVYTTATVQALRVPASAGLSTADTVALSNRVRALVADPEYDRLPASWRGRPAFDTAAVSHLLDVRAVISGARVAVGIVALLLAAYAAWCVAKRRFAPLGRGMRWGALGLVAGTIIAVVAAVTSFDALFTAFHGLFFSAGTWVFPEDSLLIRLFPERFWVASGAAWAVLIVVGAAVLGVSARLLGGNLVRGNASRSENYV